MTAWVLFSSALVLSVVPAADRPVTGAPSWLEHLAFFLICGSTFALGYPQRVLWLCAGAISYTAILELLQFIAPSRHARVSDFVIDALSALLGITLATLTLRYNITHVRSLLPSGATPFTAYADGRAPGEHRSETSDD